MYAVCRSIANPLNAPLMMSCNATEQKAFASERFRLHHIGRHGLRLKMALSGAHPVLAAFLTSSACLLTTKSSVQASATLSGEAQAAVQYVQNFTCLQGGDVQRCIRQRRSVSDLHHALCKRDCAWGAQQSDFCRLLALVDLDCSARELQELINVFTC
jgi:hypothetical protein